MSVSNFKGLEQSDTEILFEWDYTPSSFNMFLVSFEDKNTKASYSLQYDNAGFNLYYDTVSAAYTDSIFVDKFDNTFRLKSGSTHNSLTGGTKTVTLLQDNLYYFNLSDIDSFLGEGTKSDTVVIPIRSSYSKYSRYSLDSGISFPFNFTENGGVKSDLDNDHILSNVKNFISTNFGERVMRGGFGSNASSLIFSNTYRPEYFNLMEALMQRELRKYDKIKNVGVKISKGEEGQIIIFVKFTIINSEKPIELNFVSI